MSIKDDLQDLRELEDLREGIAEGCTERKRIDQVILVRKREMKGRAESLEKYADLFDKAALPLGAAIPGFISILGSAGYLTGPSHSLWMVLGSLMGAMAWVVLRILALTTAISARRDLAKIGKVD